MSRSNAESEYRSITHTTCKMMWLRSLMAELGFSNQSSMPMYCNNQTAIYIANNPVFHKHTKHIKVDYHYVKDATMNGYISTPFTSSFEQLADIFTKDLPLSRLKD